MLKIECNLSAVPPETLVVAGLVGAVVIAVGIILGFAGLALFRVGLAPVGRAAVRRVWERWQGVREESREPEEVGV